MSPLLLVLAIVAFLGHEVDAFDRLGESLDADAAAPAPAPANTRGLPFFLSADEHTVVQAGGLPVATSVACEDPSLSSRSLIRSSPTTSTTTTTTLFRYCTSLQPQAPPTANTTQSRIVGGTRSNGSRYRYLALLFDDNGPYCQGFLIDPEWVLTAAHCVDDNLVGIKIGANEWMVDDIVGHRYVTSKIKRQIMHEDYVSDYLSTSRKNMAPSRDIALLQLATPVTDVPPVKLATKLQSTKPPKVLTAMGFGRTGEFEPDMNTHLREVQLNYVDRKTCEIAFNKELKKGGYSGKGAPKYAIDQSLLCAGDNKTKKRDACQGDSGGPLIAKGRTSAEDVVYGITSFGEGCGRKGVAGGYTNVGYYWDWIMKTMGKRGGGRGKQGTRGYVVVRG